MSDYELDNRGNGPALGADWRNFLYIYHFFDKNFMGSPAVGHILDDSVSVSTTFNGIGAWNSKLKVRK